MLAKSNSTMIITKNLPALEKNISKSLPSQQTEWELLYQTQKVLMMHNLFFPMSIQLYHWNNIPLNNWREYLKILTRVYEMKRIYLWFPFILRFILKSQVIERTSFLANGVGEYVIFECCWIYYYLRNVNF